MLKVQFIIYDLGGGHRSIATALKRAVEQRQLHWNIEILEFYNDLVGRDISRYIYNNIVLQKKWARAFYQSILVPFYKFQIRLIQPLWLKRLRQHWQMTQPDMVVSLIPLMNHLFRISLDQIGLTEIPLITVMTDFADCPPNFWFRTEAQYYICPSKRAVQQALEIGIKNTNIFLASGLIINPRFYDLCITDPGLERQKLGLQPKLPTGLITFGSYGSDIMLTIATQLLDSNFKAQFIFVCGHHQKLAQKISAMAFSMPVVVMNYVSDMPYIMEISDFFIGKPGNVSISEAIAMNLPVITERNEATLMQEDYICDWIYERDIGILLKDFSMLNQALAKLLCPPRFQSLKGKVKDIHNHAVFEAVDFLQEKAQ